MSAPKKTSKKFVSDFELVVNYFQLKQLGEYELAKETARNDMENAIPCFAAMAGKIRDGS